ncbi:MAG: hypothetical protein JKY31_12995 [Rhodobacteraceae bacterium]|nr:hypothetical protein [Paracoccaceae bacterium]
MARLWEKFVEYWIAFSVLSQEAISSIIFALSGKEISEGVAHWTFYGIMFAILIIVIRGRRQKLRAKNGLGQQFRA